MNSKIEQTIATLKEGMMEEQIDGRELYNAVEEAVKALEFINQYQTLSHKLEVIHYAEHLEALDAPPQYDIADGVSPIKKTLKDAIAYCDRNTLPLTLIRRYEQYENEDEEEDWCPEWNYDDWTHPFGNPTEEDEHIATRFSNLHNGDI